MQATNTVVLTVGFDKNANPPVVISERKKLAGSGDTVKWQKKNAKDDFDIIDFKPVRNPNVPGDEEAFENKKTGGNGQWLTVLFSPAKPSTNYKYTLTVKSGDTEYTSDKQSNPPDDRRAVIRNGP